MSNPTLNQNQDQILNIAGYATSVNTGDITLNTASSKVIYFDVSDCKIGINTSDTSYSLDVVRSANPSHPNEGTIRAHSIVIESSANIASIDIGNAHIVGASAESIDISNATIQNLIVEESPIFKTDISMLSERYIFYSSAELPTNLDVETLAKILPTKQYVDEFVQGINVKQSAEFASLPGEDMTSDGVNLNTLSNYRNRVESKFGCMKIRGWHWKERLSVSMNT